MSDSNKPTKQFRLGRIVAAVFQNEHQAAPSTT